MGGAYRAHGKDEKWIDIQILFGKLKGNIPIGRHRHR
jgi:hypothetical protein